MAVALVMDFPGATRQQYDEVVERMQLGGRMAPGGMHHAAGSHDGGWRVVDVWESLEQFERFRDEQIVPHTQAIGMSPPRVLMIEVDEQKPASGERAQFVQVVMLPGLDRESFHAADDVILTNGQPPPEVVWHVNGPVEGGWCVIDAWTSKAVRDEFLETRVKPAMTNAPLLGPPVIEDLVVEATLGAAEPATA